MDDRSPASRVAPWPRAADGSTAMYDAVAEAVPLAATGQHRKKALVLISDGNDTRAANEPSARSSSSFARAKRSSTRSASNARGPTALAAASTVPAARTDPDSWPFPAGWSSRPCRTPPQPLPPRQGRSWTRGCSESSTSGAARHDRRQRRAHRDRSRPEGSRRSDRRHRRRTQQAGTTSGISPPERKTAAGTPFEWNHAIEATESVLVAAMSPRNSLIVPNQEHKQLKQEESFNPVFCCT